MKTKYRATIKMEDGKMLPLFATKNSTAFYSIAKAVKKMEGSKIAGRGFVWPAGKPLAETPIADVYTIAL